MLLRTLTLTALAAALTTPLPAQISRAGANSDLAQAQRAAWGRPGSTTYRIANENVTYSGGRLLQTRFGPMLIAEGKVANFSHISPGRIGAFYLRRTPRGYVRGRAFESAVAGGSMGRIASWSVSTAFTANPVIYAEGGSTNQGFTCGYASLTELTPGGPVELASFQSYFEDMNARGRDTRGRIANIVHGRSFDVVFTGAHPGRDRYVKRGARYQMVGRKPQLDGC